MTILVRDEADIIEANIRYHMNRGVDHVIAIDNGSIDGTQEILREFSKHTDLTVLNEPRQNFDQSAWMTQAALLARDQFGADWILHNDADEFWCSPDGNLKHSLARTGADILDCRRHNMLHPWDDLPDQGFNPENFVYRMRVPVSLAMPEKPLTDEIPCPHYCHALSGKVLTRTRKLLRVAQGNHDATYSKNAVREDCNIEIYHYPVRSIRQFKSKIENGGRSYMANKELPEYTGWHWRRWYHFLETYGINAALADALPDRKTVAQWLRDQTLIEDRRMLQELNRP